MRTRGIEMEKTEKMMKRIKRFMGTSSPLVQGTLNYRGFRAEGRV
jgi:hypothetical protein